MRVCDACGTPAGATEPAGTPVSTESEAVTVPFGNGVGSTSAGKRVEADRRPTTSADAGENLATRVANEFNAAVFDRGDFDAGRALVHPEATALDTRPVVGLGETIPAERFIETLETYWTEDHGASLSSNQVVATRSDGFVVERSRLTLADASEVDVVVLTEIDASGLITAFRFFGDIPAAVAALDARYSPTIEGRGAALVRLSNEHQRALWTQDWALLDRLIAPDFEFADRRSLSTIELDRAGYMARIEAVADEYTYAWWSRTLERLTETDGVATISSFATTADGELLEWEFVGVTQMHDGQFTRFEYYDLDRLDDAVARYEKLRASTSDVVPIAEA